MFAPEMNFLRSILIPISGFRAPLFLITSSIPCRPFFLTHRPFYDAAHLLALHILYFLNAPFYFYYFWPPVIVIRLSHSNQVSPLGSGLLSNRFNNHYQLLVFVCANSVSRLGSLHSSRTRVYITRLPCNQCFTLQVYYL